MKNAALLTYIIALGVSTGLIFFVINSPRQEEQARREKEIVNSGMTKETAQFVQKMQEDHLDLNLSEFNNLLAALGSKNSYILRCGLEAAMQIKNKEQQLKVIPIIVDISRGDGPSSTIIKSDPINIKTLGVLRADALIALHNFKYENYDTLVESFKNDPRELVKDYLAHTKQ